MKTRAALIGAMRFLVGGRAFWVGCRPSNRQRVYFCNHASHMDSLLVWAALPASLRPRAHPVAAEDYWGHGRLRRFFALEVLGAVLVRRGGGMEALAPLEDALEAGESLIFYPEGTRGETVLPAPFKSGLYHLAAKHREVEYVPVYLDNLNRALPKGAWLPVPVSASVFFGAPLALEPDESRDAFLARARAAIVALAQGVHPELRDD